ncbi:MAG: nickel-dependent lactate racemase [Gemmatimonadota bacterium]|nr:nickel-dependent lactate racemase [Gemmatimonadota bacterium]
MVAQLPFDRQTLQLEVPDDTIVFRSSFPSPPAPPGQTVLDALRSPPDGLPLTETLKNRRSGNVVIVVSDITRPIPYSRFLGGMLEEIESSGVGKKEILILVANGMHRPSTPGERERMFGAEINASYRIIDHHADRADELVELEGKSRSGNRVRLNRHFIEAGFRIVTGLVEPHFMAGFSGGRKAVCPGLVSLETVNNFHGYAFLSDKSARNGILTENPCHEESLSIARLAGVDFSLNLVLDKDRNVVRAFAGDLESSHEAASDFVRQHACRDVPGECDVVLTSSGGYPLDATFYQCVKGMVSCLPAVRENGIVVSVGGCREGIGSREYKELMGKYSGRWREFLIDIEKSEEVKKDQWQFQMQARVLEKTGCRNLYFITDALPAEDMEKLCVNGISAERGMVEKTVQEVLDRLLLSGGKLAVLPEGPYCALVE